MEIKIKKLNPEVKLPNYAHADDAGMDLYSLEDYELMPGEKHTFALGIATEFSSDLVAIIHGKSGLANKYEIAILGGVIDAGYRGEWQIILKNLGKNNFKINKNDKIAQAVLHKIERLKITEVDDLSDSTRGTGWAGSTGK